MVRRAVAGRRVLARDGARRAHPVRRRAGLLGHSLLAALQDRDHQRRLRGQRLVGRHPRRPVRPTPAQDRVRRHVHARRLHRRQRAVLQRRRRRQLRHLRHRGRRLPADQPVRDGRRRHHARGRSRTAAQAEYGWSTAKQVLCASPTRNCGSATTPAGPLAWQAGGGGGTSYTYTQPSYQAGVVPAALALRNEALFGPVPLRVEPDISMDADAQSGMLIGLTQTFPNGSTTASSRKAAPASPPRCSPA